MKYDDNNIFANIINKKVSTDIIMESEYAIAFNDIAPQAPIHILIIPKKPLLDISDFLQNAESLYQTNFWKSVDEIIDILGLRDKGFQIKTHKGKDGGQEVFHFHLHLLSNV